MKEAKLTSLKGAPKNQPEMKVSMSYPGTILTIANTFVISSSGAILYLGVWSVVVVGRGWHNGEGKAREGG